MQKLIQSSKLATNSSEYRPDNINNPPVGANDIFKIWKILENNNNDEKRFAENREIIIMRDFFAPKAGEKIRFTAFSGPQNVFYTSIARSSAKIVGF